MSALALFFLAITFAVVLMLAMWWHQYRTTNANLVDVAWSGGVGVLALLYAFLAQGDTQRRFLIALLAGAWSLRLAWHIFRRVAGEQEDGRYQNLRAHWREQTQLKFFLFYLAQALAVVVFSIPLLVVAVSSEPLPGWAASLAVFIWLVAVGGETLADRQLAAWKREPRNRGRTCRAGLWRYSRHPNYFFEWLHWFAYVPLAWGSPWWWLTLLGPALMLFLLFRVTGIPHTERQAVASRGEDYRAYQRATSMFFPWFPNEEKDLENRH